jgi:hypothetical protein
MEQSHNDGNPAFDNLPSDCIQADVRSRISFGRIDRHVVAIAGMTGKKTEWSSQETIDDLSERNFDMKAVHQ